MGGEQAFEDRGFACARGAGNDDWAAELRSYSLRIKDSSIPLSMVHEHRN